MKKFLGSNSLIKKIICIILLVVMICIPSSTLAVTINSIEYYDNLQYSTYDIRGVINDNTEISTSYDNDGYNVYFKVGDNEELVREYISGETKTNDGVELKITATPAGDNKCVNVVYNVKNVSAEEKQFAIATTADVNLADNDCATMYKDETSIVQITQDKNEYDSEYDIDYSESYGTQVKVSFSPVATTTWIGFYDDAYYKKYVNGEVTSYTYDDDDDTGFAFSWSGKLAPGNETSYTASYSIKEADVGSVKFYKKGETEPFTTVNGLIGGSIITPPAQIQLETGYRCYWNTKEDGSGTEYRAERRMVVTSKEMKLYEFNKSLWHASTIVLVDGMDIGDGNKLNLIDLLLEKGLLDYEDKIEEACSYIYSKDGKLLFKIDDDDIVALAEGLTYEDNIEYIPTEEDKERLAELGVYVNKVILSFGNEPKPIEYEVLEGANQTYKIGENENLTFRFDIDYDTFKTYGDVWLDGMRIEEDNYTSKSGSTVLTFNDEFTNALSEGEHHLEIALAQGRLGVAKTDFTIEKANNTAENTQKSESDTINNPKTGDNIVIWTSLMVISLLGIVGTIKMHKKINKYN